MTNPDDGQQQQQQQQLPYISSTTFDQPPAAVEEEDDDRPTNVVVQDDPSPRTLQLWREVANGIDKHQTVVWQNSVDSLEDGLQYFHTSNDARQFVERYMRPVISILLEQIPHKTGITERGCVEASLKFCLQIIEEDIKTKVGVDDNGNNSVRTVDNIRDDTNEHNNDLLETCNVIDVLAMIFSKKRPYYKGSKMSGWNNNMNGLPNVRTDLINKFTSHGMFGILAIYLNARAGRNEFPALDVVHEIVVAADDAMENLKRQDSNHSNDNRTHIENDLINVCKAVMKHLVSSSENYLKNQGNNILANVRCTLQYFFDNIFDWRREDTNKFYEFCRGFAFKLICSQSLPLKLFGWETITDLIETAQKEYRPPPKSYIVSGAGTPYVNGVYHFAADLATDGYVSLRSDLRYEHYAPIDNEEKDKGSDQNQNLKKITLFRCTMRSQQKWWFLSHADEQNPGTDKDFDYYQHKSKKHEEDLPSCLGWTIAKGADPPPKLQPKGILVPPGEEFNTMEHQMAQWAISSKIIEVVLGSSIHREIVLRSTPLIQFLADMCTKNDYDELAAKASNVGPNAYCLQASHLTLAWNTCKSKLDAAASAAVYQLLVSILPSLPDSLAIHLLETIHHSLQDENGGDYLYEVAEFCSVLAIGTVDSNIDGSYMYSDEVRARLLRLLWSVITHPEAHNLKCYHNIKFYITQELQVEPMGTMQRESFLQLCKQELITNSSRTQIDENVALRTVNLTHFVLESCPLEQSAQLVFANNGELATLLFNELIGYLNRRSHIDTTTMTVRKAPSNLMTTTDFQHSSALSERLNIIRYVYGISGTVEMSYNQLDSLWKLCDTTADREAIMVFIANASTNKDKYGPSTLNETQQPQHLTPSYSNDVQLRAFQSLFCSSDVKWDNLGLKAYRSFQIVYTSLKSLVQSFAKLEGPALDTLWRICLFTVNNEVALQAMKDLLHIYSLMSENDRQANNVWTKGSAQKIPDDIQCFADKIFSCIESVKESLQSGKRGSERSAERCMRILNAAITHANASKKHHILSTLHFKPSNMKDFTHNVEDVLKILPHGLRGQACYRTISIVAKRASSGPLPATENFLVQVHPFETLASINKKVAAKCRHNISLVKPISLNNNRTNLNIESEDSIVDDLGISEGSEVVYLLCNNTVPQNSSNKNGQIQNQSLGLSMADIFGDNRQGPSDDFFETLLDVIEALPKKIIDKSTKNEVMETQSLVWNLLQSVPSNQSIVDKVRTASQYPMNRSSNDDEMIVDYAEWDALLDLNHYQKAVYVLEVVDSFLQPCMEIMELIDSQKNVLKDDAVSFRQSFVDSGGFNATIRFFSRFRSIEHDSNYFRRENDCAIRIIKCCLMGRDYRLVLEPNRAIQYSNMDDIGRALLKTLSSSKAFYTNLTGAVVSDDDVSDIVVINSLLILQTLFISDHDSSSAFVSIDCAEKFVTMLLIWKSKMNVNSVSLGIGSHIRKTTGEMILSSPRLSSDAFPWFLKALGKIDFSADCSEEYFSLMIQLVDLNKDANRIKIPAVHLHSLVSTLCKKLATCPRPDTSPSSSSSILSGCLKLLQTLIDAKNIPMLADGVKILLNITGAKSWSTLLSPETSGNNNDALLIDLIGVIFDIFLSDGNGSTNIALCSDQQSRRCGFDILINCANLCKDGNGYLALSTRIRNMITSSAPFLRHRWGQITSGNDAVTLNNSANSIYSGLKNQGCTCYMNSVLQQLFMMPELRKSLCSATLPRALSSSGCGSVNVDANLVGKRISMQWENGTSYEALVEAYNDETKMHRIRYLIPKVRDARFLNAQPSLSKLRQELPDEFLLNQGRQGKETGVFNILNENKALTTESNHNMDSEEERYHKDLNETKDEILYRHLLEEVQRTFVYLDKGSRGRAFDPRSLVEASACLKLEFDIWQQNDASEFAMKLLDKLEVPLKRWSPQHFKFLEHTFRLKQTKQKLCKECGLKTNREENLMNIDCQIRGKSDIHEALSTMCEAEYMEGDNKVFCDNCKKNCDTVLRTAISALPDMLILSLKRFDLDYNTFETVKLNSRCAFEESLNMKKYTLEGVEAMEKNSSMNAHDDVDETYVDPLRSLPDDDYEYKLAGVLVHHGVAQGGHYYSFIRDRTTNNGSSNEWFRFDDDEVTPFDPSQIEMECFGGKVKKETKWPNGQVNTVETDQLANALMLFYEKVKPTKFDSNDSEKDIDMVESTHIPLATGVEVFENDVKRSNNVHRSHVFLFDTEFQRFLRQMLDASLSVHNVSECVTWSIPILELSTVYFFDILLHSVDKNTLSDWIDLLSSALSSPLHGSSFTHEIARRTRTINENWLRIFASDCPEDTSRSVAMKIIATAIRSCLGREEEVSALKSWTQAMSKQIYSLDSDISPVSLQKHEDIDKMVSFESSSLGIIISFICLLLDLAPRTWQYNIDLCALIREISNISIEGNGDVLRDALISVEVPARLIALFMRDKSPIQIMSAFPDLSLSFERIECIAKVISFGTHLYPLNNNMTSGVGDNSSSIGSPCPSDHLNTLEALAVVIGINFAKREMLIVETGEVKGRFVYDLTSKAKESLKVIFDECSSRPGLMNESDVLNYLQVCCVYSEIAASSQRVNNMLLKYGNDNNDLTIDGFLKYYRDASQSNTVMLCNDLRSFGFRPDLTRIKSESMIKDNDIRYNVIESVAIDVFSLGRPKVQLSPLVAAGLSSLKFYQITYYTDTHLTELFLAWSCLNKNTDKLLLETLKCLYDAQPYGNEAFQINIMVLMVLAAFPDDQQRDRITSIMLSQEKLNARTNVGSGLLIVANQLSLSQSSHQYSNDYHAHRSMLDKYIDAIKELQKISAVAQWLSENKDQWEWMSPYLQSESWHSQEREEDHISRRNRSHRIDTPGTAFYEQGQSDSDLGGDINDSDSDYGEITGSVVVKGAGLDAINGIYVCHNKKFDSVSKFTKRGLFNGASCEFTLFRCVLSDNTRRWYISIVPENSKPGTNADVDFYYCTSSGTVNEIPHGYDWSTAAGNGINPPPTVEYNNQPSSISDDNDDDDNMVII